VVHGQISQDLAVEFDVVGVELAHQLAVGQSVHASTRVDTGDPQGAEVALFSAAVTVGVTKGFFDGVFGDRPNIFAATEVAFCHFEYALAACTRSNIIYRTWHRKLIFGNADRFGSELRGDLLGAFTQG
jgi:hypothetical protein